MNKVIGIVAMYTGYAEVDIKGWMDLREDLGADSVTMYEIASAVETLCEMEKDIPLGKIDKVRTVSDIECLVNEYTLAI
jgi:acyl carrier protein